MTLGPWPAARPREWKPPWRLPRPAWHAECSRRCSWPKIGCRVRRWCCWACCHVAPAAARAGCRRGQRPTTGLPSSLRPSAASMRGSGAGGRVALVRQLAPAAAGMGCGQLGVTGKRGRAGRRRCAGVDAALGGRPPSPICASRARRPPARWPRPPRRRDWARGQSRVHYIDCSSVFLSANDRSINADLMPDALHPGGGAGGGMAQLAHCIGPLIAGLL